MKNKKSNTKGPQIKVGINTLALVCIFGGAIIFIGTDYVLSILEKTKFSIQITLIKGISSITINLIVIAFISLLLELTSLKKYIHYVVHQGVLAMEKLISDKYAWDYSRLNADELKHNLDTILFEIAKRECKQQKDILLSNNNMLEMTDFLVPKIINDFVNGEYYEDYNISLRIYIQNESYVKFIVNVSYIVNNCNTKTFEFQAMYPTKKSYESLHFEHFLIFSKDVKVQYFDLTSEINGNIRLVNIRDKQKHHNIYCVKSNADFSSLPTNDYYIEHSRTYLKNIENGVFVHSISKPVKNFHAEIILDNDIMNKYKIYGISFFPYKQVHNQADLKMKEQSNGPHNLTIHNSNWCLPGSGFSITLMKNIDLLENNS